MKRGCILLFLYFISPPIWANRFEPEASYQVCFTLAERCTDLIVEAINQAKKQILVQAYSFTSVPIAKALLKAHKQGVQVNVILDRSQYRHRGFSSAKLFLDYQVPVWIDDEPAIAHNKVMVIDSTIVITGSFNFTRAAEERNAENVILIKDKGLAKRYIANWNRRQLLSKELSRPRLITLPGM